MIQPALIQPSSVILATGGARGITAACVIRLAERFHCKFILVGRSAANPAEAAWAEGISDPGQLKTAGIAALQTRGEKPTPAATDRLIGQVLAKREIEDTLQKVQSAGGEAVYISADISQPGSLASRLQEVTTRWGPVRGILHGAGGLADKLIEKKTTADFYHVLDPKIHGLSNLLDQVSPNQLDFLVLFSSVVSLYGNAGQADYSIANQILDRSAGWIQKRYPKCRVITINWGPWEGGMVSPQLKQFFTDHNVKLISYEEGAQTLVDLLTTPQKPPLQVVVGDAPRASKTLTVSGSKRHVTTRTLRLEDNPFLLDHVIGENPVLPATCAAAWLIHASEQCVPGYQFRRLDDFRVLKGIVFDDSLADSYRLVLDETHQDGRAVEIQAKVISKNLSGKEFFHYSGLVHLVDPEEPVITRLDEQKLGEIDRSAAEPGAGLYANGCLFHGPAFQGVREVYQVSPDGLRMQIRHPQVEATVQGQFPVQSTNPFLNDAVVQCLLIWSQKYEEAPCLPSRLDFFEQYLPVRFGEEYYVNLSIRSHTTAAVVGDIRVQDAQGRDCMFISGLEGTISHLLKRLIKVGA